MFYRPVFLSDRIYYKTHIKAPLCSYHREALFFISILSGCLPAGKVGAYCGDLFEGTNHAITIDILKGAMRKFAFDTPGILKLELSGQVILDFLLDHFVPAVLYYDSAYCTDGQAPSKADKKLLAIFSGNYKQDYQNTRTGPESFDLYLRLLMVTDYISGMTDSYARTLYRELSGIE